MITKTNYEYLYNHLNDNEEKLKKIINTNIRYLLVCIKDVDRVVWEDKDMSYAKKSGLLGQKLAMSRNITMLQDILVGMMKLRMWGES